MKNLNVFYKLSAIFAAFLLMGGCASVQMASDAEDQAAKQFQPKSNMARIYVYRNETFGAALKMPVSIDGQIIGETASKTYLFKDVTPGQHIVRSHTEKTPELKIDAQANKVYFVWPEVKMGMWQGNSMLHLMNDAEGRAGLMECKLASGMK